MTQTYFSWRKPVTATATPNIRQHRSGNVIPLLAALLVAGLVAGCATTPAAGNTPIGARNIPMLAPGIPMGYLTSETRPDSLKLLPPPPAPGSAAMAFDEGIRNNAVALRGSARWKQAALDAHLIPGHVLKIFECALGTATGQQQTPRLYQMMQRVMVDAGYSSAKAKEKYQRLRPFAVHNDAMCTPEDARELGANGSYPSGHSAIGWASALVLAQLAPDRADRLIARGRSFGESRIVCNVHWKSDVVSGRVMAAATVARLQSVPEFVEDVAIARQELARSKAAGIRPAKNCNAEAAVLSESLKDAW